MKEIVVWVVYADNHDYDNNSQWLVGVYSSEAEAEEATKTDETRNNAAHQLGASVNYNTQTAVLKLPKGI